MTVSNLLVVASLVLFAALVAAFSIVLRRTARVVAAAARTRRSAATARRCADRAAAAIAAGCERIDRVRRRQDAPTELDDVLAAMLEALDGSAVEAECARPARRRWRPLRARIVGGARARGARDRDRRSTAASLLAATSGRPREMEGETSIKRGYLNLLHAREALVMLGVDLRSGTRRRAALVQRSRRGELTEPAIAFPSAHASPCQVPATTVCRGIVAADH